MCNVGIESKRSEFVKVSGHVSGKSIEFLIDSGASHNFISAELLSSLGLHA